MKAVQEHFACGRYLQCVEILEKVLMMKPFSPSQLQAKSNITVCKLLMDLSVSTANCMGVQENCMEKLHHCLLQIQSFPAVLVHMETELTILYNWMYLKLSCNIHSSKQKLQTLLTECGLQCFKTLCRVLSAMKQHKDSLEIFEEDIVALQLQKLTKYTEILKVYKMVSPLCFAGCAWSTLLMYCGKLKESQTCLESLASISSKTSDDSQIHMSLTGLLLSLSDTSNCNSSELTPGLSSRELVHLLKGVCHYRLLQWADCRESLTLVNTQSLQPNIRYIIGQCHLHEEHPDDGINSLQDLIGGDNSSISPRNRARLLLLMGQCYDRKWMHQCAVQMFREALQIDFNFILPLYYISQQYQKLSLEDAQLEALNLLTTILENTSSENCSPHHPPVTSVWTLEILQHTCPDPCISLPQALYTLAHRCLHLHRYQDGAPRFLDLLALLYESPHLPQSSSSVVDLPDIRVIYLETAECLQRAAHHADCISVCDKALDSICLRLDTSVSSTGADDISFLLTQDDTEELSETISCSSRKRPRMESCDLGLANQNKDCWQELRHYMTLTLYKVDALIGLKEKDTAVKSLHRAIEALQECIGCWSGEDGGDMLQTTEPASKRWKMGEDEVLIGTGNTESDDSTHCWKPLFVDACCKLSSLLADQDKHSDALHYARLAVQILPGDHRPWFLCCSVLDRQGREGEAVRTWLQHQGVGNLTDYHRLTRELKIKQEQLRKLSTEDSDSEVPCGEVTEKNILERDVRSLEYLVQHRQSQHR